MSEIKKEFFEVFEIKPKYKICPFHHCIYKKEYDCDNCDDREWIYPQITDRILLELTALCQRKTYDEYKNECLIKTIEIMGGNAYKISQVQAIFKEDNEE